MLLRCPQGHLAYDPTRDPTRVTSQIIEYNENTDMSAMMCASEKNYAKLIITELYSNDGCMNNCCKLASDINSLQNCNI